MDYVISQCECVLKQPSLQWMYQHGTICLEEIRCHSLGQMFQALFRGSCKFKALLKELSEQNICVVQIWEYYKNEVQLMSTQMSLYSCITSVLCHLQSWKDSKLQTGVVLVFKGFQKASQVYCTGMIPQILSKQVDILIPKNQVLQIYLKHHDNVYKTP